MGEKRVIAVDLARVVGSDFEERPPIGWGHPVELIDETATRLKVVLTEHRLRSDGTIEPVTTERLLGKEIRGGGQGDEVLAKPEDLPLLKVDFVDVQQGDATVIESPAGQVVLLDGGENQLFARYLAGRYRGTTPDEPKDVECIVVSHGDADHFQGLNEIHRSETAEVDPKKRLFLRPHRVFHNGLVKRPNSVPETERLGPTRKEGDDVLLTGLVDDLRKVDDKLMNTPFRGWKAALRAYGERHDMEVRHLSKGDHDAFDFLAPEGIHVEVLGPIPIRRGGTEGLRFLGEPERRFSHPSQMPETRFTGQSASHTINGHSIVIRLAFGDWRFLFAGDLNEESERAMLEAHARGDLDLTSEVLKVPHHGAADFLPAFLKAVSPVVSVVSSGDEDEQHEHVHPRATLMSALGKHGRDDEPVVFVTELVAFFEKRGFVLNRPPAGDKGRWASKRTPFFAFERTAFGIVAVRTDGKRLLTWTNSGEIETKEIYAYRLKDGRAIPQPVRIAKAPKRDGGSV